MKTTNILPPPPENYQLYATTLALTVNSIWNGSKVVLSKSLLVGIKGAVVRTRQVQVAPGDRVHAIVHSY